MKTTALILFSFIMIFSGSLKITKSGNYSENNFSDSFYARNSKARSLEVYKEQLSLYPETDSGNKNVSGNLLIKPSEIINLIIPIVSERESDLDPAIESWMSKPLSWSPQTKTQPDSVISGNFDFENPGLTENDMNQDVPLEEWMIDPVKWVNIVQ